MKDRSSPFRSPGPWVWLALALVVAAVPLLLSPGAAGPSVLSRGPDGWVGARAYLAARGVELTLLDAPPTAPAGGALVTAFPWQSSAPATSVEPFRRFARGGGFLAVGFSGEAPRPSEDALLNALGCPTFEARPSLPLAPVAWWRYRHEVWQGEPVDGASRPLSLRAPSYVPEPPEGAQIHYIAGAGDREIPLVFSFPLGEGRVLVLPAQAIANGFLGQPGNVDLLENLRQWLGNAWAVDEAAHGLRPVNAEGVSSAGGLAFDLFALHLLMLYGLAILGLTRRFGPPWREPPARTGSARSFLLGLGALHHRLGHHRDAGRRLLSRIQELEPNLDLEAAVGRVQATDGKSLVRLARRVSALRRGEP